MGGLGKGYKEPYSQQVGCKGMYGLASKRELKRGLFFNIF
jgi:hypothetical protein